MKDLLYPMRRIHGYIADPHWKELNLPIGQKCFVIGTPEHPNIGDSAIAIAEINFISTCLPCKSVKEITFLEYPRYHEFIDKVASFHSYFFGTGGG